MKKTPRLNQADRRIAPGDQARPGTPAAGENFCRECRGSGRYGGRECQNCGGAGYVLEGIGGA